MMVNRGSQQGPVVFPTSPINMKAQPRYVYRAKHYDAPPADWPAPRVACWQCRQRGIDHFASFDITNAWRWNGYEWLCANTHV